MHTHKKPVNVMVIGEADPHRSSGHLVRLLESYSTGMCWGELKRLICALTYLFGGTWLDIRCGYQKWPAW